MGGGAISFEDVRRMPCNVLIGNSTAFGVAATGDDATISSALSRRSGEPWLNLTGRSYNSTQELILFQTHLDALSNVKRIVIFSGANNLLLHFRSPDYPARYGTFFFWRTFDQAMRRAALSPNRRRLAALLQRFYGSRIDYDRISPADLLPALFNRMPGPTIAWPGAEGPRSRDEVIAWMARDLKLWRILSDSLGAEILFVLQPLGGWVSKTRTAEEEELFAEVGRSPRKFNRTLAHDFDAALHDWYAGALAGICRGLGLPFLDMNAALATPSLDRRWIFNDYIHLTDEGYSQVAAMISDALGIRAALPDHAKVRAETVTTT